MIFYFKLSFQSFAEAAVRFRLALCPLAIVVFCPHSIINIILLFDHPDQGSAILILDCYWIRNYFVDRSVDTMFISGRSRIWSRLHWRSLGRDHSDRQSRQCPKLRVELFELFLKAGAGADDEPTHKVRIFRKCFNFLPWTILQFALSCTSR